MPSYAILGATGNTGRALLSALSSNPSNELHLYARSESKLLSQNSPWKNSIPPSIKLFTGPLTDTSLLYCCITGVSTIFVVVGVEGNIPHLTLAQDTAHVLISVFQQLKSESPGQTLPRIIFLSSAFVNPKLSAKRPAFLRWILWQALGNVYRDLVAAEALLAKEKSWLTVTFIQPAGLSEADDRVLGHEVSTEEAGPGFLSYPDLARGMIEVAESGLKGEGKYDWVATSVRPKAKEGEVKLDYGRMAKTLVKGILVEYLPWVYGKI